MPYFNSQGGGIHVGVYTYKFFLVTVLISDFTAKYVQYIYMQTWKNNMGNAGKVRITSSSSDYTKVHAYHNCPDILQVTQSA